LGSLITGIHDIYGKLFDELRLGNIFAYPSRNKSSISHFKNIVLARIAKPDSKRGSVNMLEENFGISLNLGSVYKTIPPQKSRQFKNKSNFLQNSQPHATILTKFS